MTTYTNFKNIPVPDTGQEEWADEVQEAFDIIDASLKDITETSVDKSTATFDGVNIDSSLSLDDGVSLALGTDEDLTATYNATENTTYVTDTSSGDTIFAIPHGSGQISVGRGLTDSTSGSAYATESYADSTAQSTADSVVNGDIAPSSVDTGALSVDGNAVQASVDGYVSVIGQGAGLADAIDPSTTGTPVQDAVDATGGKGYVIIPPQGVDEDTTVTVGDNVSIIGFGPGYTNSPVSDIRFQDPNNDCIVLSNGGGNFVEFNTIDGIHINGPSRTEATGKGITAPDGANQLHIGHVDIRNLGNEVFYTNEWNEIRIDQLRCSKVEPQHSNVAQAYHFDGPGAGGSVGLLSGYPYGNSTDSDLTRFVHVNSGQVNIDYINVGGVAWQALATSGGKSINVGGINHEPSALDHHLSTKVNANCAVRNYGFGVCNIDHVQITGGTGDITWDYVYRTGGADNYGWEFGPVRQAASVSNTFVGIQSDTTSNSSAPCIWHGRSDQITNNSGTSPLSQPVNCLGDLTQFTG